MGLGIGVKIGGAVFVVGSVGVIVGRTVALTIATWVGVTKVTCVGKLVAAEFEAGVRGDSHCPNAGIRAMIAATATIAAIVSSIFFVLSIVCHHNEKLDTCLVSAPNYEVGGIYFFYIASSELTLVPKCGKGPLLRGVEPCERGIGRMHGRRLLCVGWQNERLAVGAFSTLMRGHPRRSFNGLLGRASSWQDARRLSSALLERRLSWFCACLESSPSA